MRYFIALNLGMLCALCFVLLRPKEQPLPVVVSPPLIPGATRFMRFRTVGAANPLGCGHDVEQDFITGRRMPFPPHGTMLDATPVGRSRKGAAEAP